MISTTLSIVIPTHNRYQKLIRLLGSIRDELRGQILEVVVVDDGSDDETCRFEGFPEFNQRVRRIRNSGPAAARNLGAREAKGDVLLFLDDDCMLPQGYRVALEHVLSERTWDLAGGAICALYESSRETWVSRFLRNTQHLERPYLDSQGAYRCLPSAHLFVSRTAFLRLNGFDERFKAAAGEDNNLTQRAMRSGLDVVRLDRIWVYHEHVTSLRALIDKFFAYGKGNALNCNVLGIEPIECELKAANWVELVFSAPRMFLECCRIAIDMGTGNASSTAFLLFVRELSYYAGGIIGLNKAGEKETLGE